MAACTVWIPLAGWMVVLIGWMIAGDIETPTGLAGIVLGGLLGLLTVNPPIPGTGPLFFCMILATMLIYPVLRLAIQKREMVSIDIEQIESAYEALSQKPDNVGAKIKLSKGLFDRGMPGPAIAIMEGALLGMPRNLVSDELRTLSSWKLQASDPNHFRPLTCLSCSAVNQPSDIFCKRCRGAYLLERAKGAWMGSTLIKKVIGVWIVVVLLVGAIPATAAGLPMAAAVPLIVVEVAFGVWLCIRAFSATAEPA